MSRSHSPLIQFNATPQRVYWLSAYAHSDQPSADRSPGQMYAQSGPIQVLPPSLAEHPEWLSVHDLDEEDEWAVRRGED